MKLDAKKYDEMRKAASPPSPLLKDCLWAFFVGGAICLLGEGLRMLYAALGFTLTDAGTLTSATLIGLSAFTTAMGWYQKLAAKAGAGTLVPITGFANAVVAPAIEFRNEGLVSGVGAKMFIIAGPVIVYGMLASVVWGVIYHFIRPLMGGKRMRKGDTILFEAPPSAVAYAAVGGKKEAEGPLADAFDMLIADTLCGEKTWEKAESDFARYCLEAALKKGRLQADALDAVFAGDLQCQCTASAYTMRGFDTPYLGLYGACSTMAEGFGLAACMVAGGHMQYAAAMSSSHFCAAERQFRTPLDYGGKRTPTAQWTVTGAGAAILAPAGGPPYVRAVTFGRVRDYNVTDINNMGAAMAPAACETILRYFADTGEKPEHFDAIFTGDLGFVGRTLLLQLLKEEGLPLENHQDCGLLVYDRDAQNVQAGGSGAGCSATVLCCHVLPALREGRMKRVLFLSTGALMSQTTFLQGESIPGVAHLIELSSELPEETEKGGGVR